MPQDPQPTTRRNPDLGPDGPTTGWAGPWPLAILFIVIVAIIVGIIVVVLSRAAS